MQIKHLFKALGLMALMGCDKFEMPAEVHSDFKLNCLRWNDGITICEGYIDTDKISGYLKIWAYLNDPYHGDSLSLCGGDLHVNTGNLLHNYFVESETENNLSCLDADENEIGWWWDPENTLNITWEDIFFNIDIEKCPYDNSHCAVVGNGYII